MQYEITMTVGWDEDTGEEMLSLTEDRSRSMGILRFGHEFDLTLKKDLSFRSASSIDCGEASSYRKESDFEAAYPGVLREIREAAKSKRLHVRRYHWNGVRNESEVIPYESYIGG